MGGIKKNNCMGGWLLASILFTVCHDGIENLIHQGLFGVLKLLIKIFYCLWRSRPVLGRGDLNLLMYGLIINQRPTFIHYNPEADWRTARANIDALRHIAMWKRGKGYRKLSYFDLPSQTHILHFICSSVSVSSPTQWGVITPKLNLTTFCRIKATINTSIIAYCFLMENHDF